MDLIVARNCGFCVGVRNAVDLVEQALMDHPQEEVYSLGMFIHNEKEVDRLVKKGLRVVSSLEEVPDGSLILLPSHGTPPEIRALCERKRLRPIDLICVYVRNLQDIALSLHYEGYSIVMLGDPNHPEVIALRSMVPNLIVVDKEDVLNDNLSFKFVKYGVISQTTQSLDLYKNMTSNLLSLSWPKKEIRVFNTICWDVVERQREVVELAKTCDVVIVIGGKKSANTRRLYELASEYCRAYHISDSEEIEPNMVGKGVKRVGIISGTSTPDWLVQECCDKLNRLKKAT